MTGLCKSQRNFSKATITVIDQIFIRILTFTEHKDIHHFFPLRAVLKIEYAFFLILVAKTAISRYFSPFQVDRENSRRSFQPSLSWMSRHNESPAQNQLRRQVRLQRRSEKVMNDFRRVVSGN